ncbi:MAG TPA: sigma 54-interacting transcriptional regulator [Terriglobales bacterium]|nr:sigma 54-interacting transcriptional regulator [Terriglobales bacterium]
MVSGSVAIPVPYDTSIRRYEALLRASAAVAVCRRDSRAVMERFARELQRFVRFDYVLITVIDEATGHVKWRVFQAFDDPGEVPTPQFPPDESPTGLAYESQQPVIIADWQEETRYPRLREMLEYYGIRSSVALPLSTMQRRLGTLAIGVSVPNAYSEDEVRFLTLVSDHLALAVDSALSAEESAKAQAALQRKKDLLQLTLDLTNRLVTSLDLRDLLREVSVSVRNVMKCDATGVALPNADGTQLHFYALDFPDGKGFLTSETPIDIDHSPLGVAFRTGQPQTKKKSDVNLEPGCDPHPALREGLNSCCFVPLISRGRALGVLALSRFTEEGFGAEEISFLRQIAGQIAIAVENALAYGQIAELKEKLAQEKLYLEDEIRGEIDFEGIVGQSSVLRNVLHLVDTVAGSDSTVLLLGETGTGKELIARAIHERSRRSERTFVKMNCAAIPTGLLESEIFGHERGAFTGAVTQKLGRLELADKGTLFLDEIGDIPLEIQPKLLRALQEREFERLGSTVTKKVDVRLVAATNRDLEKMIENREFRSDLYYRLNVFPIRIPPLRERPDDIPLLVRYFAQKYARRMEKQIDAIPASAMKELMAWHWPGNIRELENFVERAVILSRGSALNFPLKELRNGVGRTGPAASVPSDERQEMLRVLNEADWQVGGTKGAAARLGLKRTTFISRMKKLGITAPSQQVS